MSRFSNINWRAIAFGTLGNTPWFIIISGIVIAIVSYGDNRVGITILLMLTSYFLLAPMTIYYALQGNSILLRDIQELKLDAEEEKKSRMLEAACQRKTSPAAAIFLRVALSYGMLGYLPIRNAYWAAGLTFEHSLMFRAFSIMLLVDLVVFATIFSVAFVRGSENVLYSGEIPAEIMDAVSTRKESD